MILSSSQSVYQYALKRFINTDVEELHCIAINNLCGVIDSRMVTRGTVNACFAHPRDIFRFAISCNAVSVIIIHNHPSGDVRPSYEDIKLTRRIKKAGQLLQIPMVDHIIVSPRSYFSFADSLALTKDHDPN